MCPLIEEPYKFERNVRILKQKAKSSYKIITKNNNVLICWVEENAKHLWALMPVQSS